MTRHRRRARWQLILPLTLTLSLILGACTRPIEEVETPTEPPLPSIGATSTTLPSATEPPTERPSTERTTTDAPTETTTATAPTETSDTEPTDMHWRRDARAWALTPALRRLLRDEGETGEPTPYSLKVVDIALDDEEPEPEPTETEEPEPEPEPTTTATPTTTAKPEPAITPPNTSLSGYATSPIDLSGYRPSGYPSKRYPQTAQEQFTSLRVTNDLRWQIVKNALYLLGVPYIYAPRIGSTYWAPNTKYTANYQTLMNSKRGGAPYSYGSDCSSYVKAVMDFTLGVSMSDTVSVVEGWYRRLHPQLERPKNDMSQWEPGDILIFDEPHTGRTMVHMGIYYGGGAVIHSVGQFIRISRLDDWSFRPRGNLAVRSVWRPPGSYASLNNSSPAPQPPPTPTTTKPTTAPTTTPTTTRPTTTTTPTTTTVPTTTTTPATTAPTTTPTTAPTTTPTSAPTTTPTTTAPTTTSTTSAPTTTTTTTVAPTPTPTTTVPSSEATSSATSAEGTESDPTG